MILHAQRGVLDEEHDIMLLVPTRVHPLIRLVRVKIAGSALTNRPNV